MEWIVPPPPPHRTACYPLYRRTGAPRWRLEVLIPRSFKDNVEFWSWDLMMKASVRLWNHKHDRTVIQTWNWNSQVMHIKCVYWTTHTCTTVWFNIFRCFSVVIFWLKHYQSKPFRDFFASMEFQAKKVLVNLVIRYKFLARRVLSKNMICAAMAFLFTSSKMSFIYISSTPPPQQQKRKKRKRGDVFAAVYHAISERVWRVTVDRIATQECMIIETFA